ncbi:hypothetical protein GIB67_008254 [Kingdonia uniflora]|uniref:Uncharacterized protein n=1 Tax=Kingdonia uniflora TaxID=39325 RepID=A0A7J7N4Q9_9MAGN|nr:hypothetical protein GIB67_008254 [Kingdonia uniflora]
MHLSLTISRIPALLKISTEKNTVKRLKKDITQLNLRLSQLQALLEEKEAQICHLRSIAPSATCSSNSLAGTTEKGVHETENLPTRSSHEASVSHSTSLLEETDLEDRELDVNSSAKLSTGLNLSELERGLSSVNLPSSNAENGDTLQSFHETLNSVLQQILEYGFFVSVLVDIDMTTTIPGGEDNKEEEDSPLIVFKGLEHLAAKYSGSSTSLRLVQKHYNESIQDIIISASELEANMQTITTDQAEIWEVLQGLQEVVLHKDKEGDTSNVMNEVNTLSNATQGVGDTSKEEHQAPISSSTTSRFSIFTISSIAADSLLPP